MESLISKLAKPFSWIVEPSLKVFKQDEKYIDIKLKIDGPTFVFPESRENHHLIAVYLGKITAENMLSKDGKVENILINLSQGHIFAGEMGNYQNIDLSRIIIPNISSNVDIKLEKKGTVKRHSTILSIEDIECNINSDDIHLLASILKSNILKLKMDLGINILYLDFTCTFEMSQNPFS